MAETHTQDHEMKMTLHVDVMLPGHADRVTTTEFRHTVKFFHDRGDGCWLCGSHEKIQIHHFRIERCLGEYIDWGPDSQLRKDFPDFPWATTKSIYEFLDSIDNGLPLCEPCHIGPIGSIHHWPWPLVNALRYMTPENRAKYLMKHVEAQANG